MDFKRIFTPQNYLILVLGTVLSLAVSPFCYAISETESHTLETDFQTISNRLYTTLSKNITECRDRPKSIKLFNLQLEKLIKQNKNIIGLCLVQNHLPLIHKNIDNKEIFPIFQFLLDNNNLLLANKLYTKAKNEADQSLISNISFIYARYYLKREKWNKVLQYIAGTYNDLRTEDANLARLFTGIALQKTKKHREAVKIYSKIPLESSYYPAARLNIATAYIRQDWWSDAQIKINDLLKNKKVNTDSEMINRLYLVLGYSLLQKEFYRDSREAFRNIEINSIYFNRALLGIVLTATNQEDFVGALNAINILKSKKEYDLSVDESHLLLPYIYEKLNQNMTAQASYSDAQKYYQERIDNITSIKNMTQHNINAQDILENSHNYTIKNNIIDISKHISVDFLINSVQLDKLSIYTANITDTLLINKFSTLREKHKKMLLNKFGDIFEQRLTYLKSYMNQSRFGLARLFDNSNTVVN